MYPNINPQPNTTQTFPFDLIAAREAFFQVLTRLHRQPPTRTEATRAYEQGERDLQQQQQHLHTLARAGLLDQVTAGVNTCMKDDARLLAVRQFLHGNTDPLSLSLSPTQMGHHVTEKLQSKHMQLTALLLQTVSEAHREREARERREAEQLARTRAELLEDSMQREYTRNSELFRLLGEAHSTLGEQVNRVPQEVRCAYDDARKSLASAQQSLDIAMRGARLAQASSQEDVIETIEKRRIRRRIRWSCCSLVAGGIGLLLVFGLAYLFLVALVH